MDTAFITPIQPIGSIGALQKTQAVQETDGSIFSGIFKSAIQNVTDTQSNLEQQQYLLATGQIDDAHTVPIAAAEAQLSIDMLVQLRNKALESYNELMRISM